MNIRNAVFTLLSSAAMTLAAPVSAQTSPSPGAPPDTPAPSQLAKDLNGDGAIERNEVVPGSSFAERFDARDKNHDGKLTKDEYWMPPDVGQLGSYNDGDAGKRTPGSQLGSGISLRAGGGARRDGKPGATTHGSGVGATQPSDGADSSDSGGQ